MGLLFMVVIYFNGNLTTMKLRCAQLQVPRRVFPYGGEGDGSASLYPRLHAVME